MARVHGARHGAGSAATVDVGKGGGDVRQETVGMEGRGHGESAEGGHGGTDGERTGERRKRESTKRMLNL